jgi:Lipocalin-like domain
MTVSVNKLSVLIVCILILCACSSSKKATDTEAVIKRNAVKGDWVLSTINYEGLRQGEKVKISLLDEGMEECLKQSTWHLPNNGKGYYSIASATNGCTAGERNIVWSYREEKGEAIFQYKKMIAGMQAHEIQEGYRFKIMAATDQLLQLQSAVEYEGRKIFIIYTFAAFK